MSKVTIKKVRNAYYFLKPKIQIVNFLFTYRQNRSRTVFPENELKESFSIPVEYLCCKMGVVM